MDVTEVTSSSQALDDGTSITNPTNTNTWSEGFLSVWHMDDDVSNIGVNASVTDATSTNADAIATIGTPISASAPGCRVLPIQIVVVVTMIDLKLLAGEGRKRRRICIPNT